ncbi:MAG: right-handed parallel beta-helix repeat-containing protein, partial [bacterium]
MFQFSRYRFFSLTVVLLCMGLFFLPVSEALAETYYVNNSDTTDGDSWSISVQGSDTNSGTSSDSPFATIRKALSAAGDGDTILIGAGTFGETIPVRQNGLRIAGSGETGSLGAEDSGTILTGSGLDSGVFVRGENNRIELIRVRNFNSHGLALNGGTGSMVRRVVSRDNGGNGIFLDNETSVSVRNALLHSNINNGLELVFSDTNVLEGIRVVNSSAAGIYVDQSNNNRIISSESLNNRGPGFWVLKSSSVRAVHNLARNNSQEGFLFEDSPRSDFRMNQASDNTNEEFQTIGNSTFIHLEKNNFLTTVSSDVNTSADQNKMELNWWATSDSTGINNVAGGNIDYIPYRLSVVDTAPGADTVAPATPPNFRADTSEPSKISLEWDQTNKNQDTSVAANQINAYRIYRDTSPTNSDWKSNHFYASNVPTDTSFVDTAINSPDTYYYRVTAVDSHTTDGNNFENESYFSPVLTAFADTFGPAIYVNDTSQIGDKFTTATGNDSKIGSRRHPLRTLEKAVSIAEPGETIYLDAGTYKDTVTLDTPDVSVIGAGKDRTVLG